MSDSDRVSEWVSILGAVPDCQLPRPCNCIAYRCLRLNAKLVRSHRTVASAKRFGDEMFLILISLIFGTAPFPTHINQRYLVHASAYCNFFSCRHSHSLEIVLQCAHMAILHNQIHFFEFSTKLRWNVLASESHKQKWEIGAPSKRRHEFRVREIIVVLLRTTKTNVSPRAHFCQLIISWARLLRVFIFTCCLSFAPAKKTERWKINIYISFQFQFSVKEAERWTTFC